LRADWAFVIDLDQEKLQAGLPLLVPADGVCDGSKLDILVDSRPAADCRSAIFILAGRSMSQDEILPVSIVALKADIRGRLDA
jgi:hypothetical protein